MDRFIVFYFEKENLKKVDLKSNMDRFIVLGGIRV